tara:strand:- start:12484 stop:12771 length:288 start_codon:yes stop_codon:yes gene_type:complete
MITLAQEIKDEDLLKAISIRFDRHFPAMNIARSIGGSGTSVPWTILEQYTPAQILEEVEERNLDISDLEVAMAKCDCCPRLVVDSRLYLKLKEEK